MNGEKESKDDLDFTGASWFGLVIGWVVSVTSHSQDAHGIKDMASVLGAVILPLI